MIGRREIWSDPQIQEFSKKFVCVVEECFFLHPPKWLNNPPNPESTHLFKTYVKNAPQLWSENTTTHQGLYVMDADGEYFSGRPGLQHNANARLVINNGWRAWNTKNQVESKPVPTNQLPLVGGGDVAKGGVKLRVVYRDFPRGEIERPGDGRFPNPYNMGWYDFSPNEALAFVGSNRSPSQVPEPIVKKFAKKVLKDAVRGQMREWRDNEWKAGQLTVKQLKKEGEIITSEIRGEIEFAGNGISYQPKIYGITRYHTQTKTFTEFKWIAAGQRSGEHGANGRSTDLGPAPMAVGLRMF